MKEIIITYVGSFLLNACFAQDIDMLNKDSSQPVNKTKTHNLTTVKPGFKIYPNPVKNKISLSVKGFEPGIVSVRIIDTKGKLLREDNRLLVSSNDEIIMFLFMPPGIYFISVNQKEKIARKRIVFL